MEPIKPPSDSSGLPWTDVERTAQRGAWQASLEGLFMKLKTAAPYLGIAAVIVLAIAAYQVLVGPERGQPGPKPEPKPNASRVHDAR